LVAWDTACKPKKQGGLGIIDIEKQNNALLMKHLDKFYNNGCTMGESYLVQAIQQQSNPSTGKKSTWIILVERNPKIVQDFQDFFGLQPNQRPQ
jgi:hypothetical protein